MATKSPLKKSSTPHKEKPNDLLQHAYQTMISDLRSDKEDPEKQITKMGKEGLADYLLSRLDGYEAFGGEGRAHEACKKFAAEIFKEQKGSAVQVQARIKGLDEYVWFKYTGKPFTLNYRGASSFDIKLGDIFGVRWSSNKKDQRLVFARPDMGLSKVISITDNDEVKSRLERNRASVTIGDVEFAMEGRGHSPKETQMETSKDQFDMAGILRQAGIQFTQLRETDGPRETFGRASRTFSFVVSPLEIPYFGEVERRRWGTERNFQRRMTLLSVTKSLAKVYKKLGLLLSHNKTGDLIFIQKEEQRVVVDVRGGPGADRQPLGSPLQVVVNFVPHEAS